MERKEWKMKLWIKISLVFLGRNNNVSEEELLVYKVKRDKEGRKYNIIKKAKKK